MAHRCFFEERLEIDATGKLTRRIWAIHGKQRLDIARQGEDLKMYVRGNLIYSNCAGYLVVFPNETQTPNGTGYYGGKIYKKEPYVEMFSGFHFGEYVSKTKYRCDIADKRPDLKYFLKKWDCRTNYGTMLKLVKIWKNSNSAVEFLMEKGLYNVACDSRLMKLSYAKKKEVMAYISHNEFEDNLTAILSCIKSGITFEEYKAVMWYMKRFDYAGYKYCKSHNVSPREYFDNLKMLRGSIHSINDPYWRFPSDFGKIHLKLAAELRKEIPGKSSADIKKIKKMVSGLSYDKSVSGYDFSIPSEYADFSHQAVALKQCLINADYTGKMAKGQCILVFMSINGMPKATAELLPDGNKAYRLGQFYGDESDRTDCKPPIGAKEALQKWSKSLLKTIKDRAVSLKISF